MGPPLMRRPPQYVNGFVDRHGKARWYFRRAGFKKVPLPGLPWSPEFMAAYEHALAGQPLQIGSARTSPGTVGALAASYFNSSDFRSLKPSSQAIYRGVIDRFCIQYGDNRVAGLKREHVVKLMAARAEKPVAANNLRKVLRAMMKHAVEIGLRVDDPWRSPFCSTPASGDQTLCGWGRSIFATGYWVSANRKRASSLRSLFTQRLPMLSPRRRLIILPS